eukprot:1693536-Amphidinium_carterae.1
MLKFSPQLQAGGKACTFHPSKTSYVNPDHLYFFQFIGRIIGKALFDGHHLEAMEQCTVSATPNCSFSFPTLDSYHDGMVSLLWGSTSLC